MVDDHLVLRLEKQRIDAVIEGWIGQAEGGRLAFAGWLELITVIESASAAAAEPAGELKPAAP